jgi:hypothetical protein
MVKNELNESTNSTSSLAKFKKLSVEKWLTVAEKWLTVVDGG